MPKHLGALVAAAIVVTVGWAWAVPALGPVAAGTPENESSLSPTSDNPIDVSMSVAPAPAVAASSTLSVVMTARWFSMNPVSVELELPAGLTSPSPTTATASLAVDQPTTMTFQLSVATGGTHRFGLTAQWIPPSGSGGPWMGSPLGGYRNGVIVVPAQGSGVFHLDDLPPGPFEGEAVASTGSLPDPPPLPPGAVAPDLGDESTYRPHAPEPQGPAQENGPDGGAQAHATFQVKACWRYVTEDGGVAQQRYAKARVWDHDSGGGHDKLWEGQTGNDGCFTSGPIPREEAAGNNQDIFIQVIMENSWVKVEGDGFTYAWGTIDFRETVGNQDLLDHGTWQPAVEEYAARQFQYATNAAWFAKNVQTLNLSQVKVRIPGDCGSSPICYSGTPGGSGTIKVPLAADKSPDDTMHEYGHHVMMMVYSDWPSPGGAHSFCGDNQNLGLAWTEGWASYFGVRADQHVDAPGTSKDTLYTRPWPGANKFSVNVNMEQPHPCDPSVVGYDNELNVAFTLWDLDDDADDGVDIYGVPAKDLATVLSACDDDRLRDYYDSAFGSSANCDWVQQGFDPCPFVHAAWRNRIDLNTPPVATSTFPNVHEWVSKTMSVGATASDNECPIDVVELYVSFVFFCPSGTLVKSDTTAPYTHTVSVEGLADGTNLFTCVRSHDGLEWSAWDASNSHATVDNTPPDQTLSGGTGTQGNAGWWISPVTLSASCGDALSGVPSDGITFRVNEGPEQPTTGGNATVASEGRLDVEFICRDRAANEDIDAVVVPIDTAAPSMDNVASCAAPGTNGWCNGGWTISLSCADSTSGVAAGGFLFRLDGGVWQPAPVGSFVVNQQGPHAMEVACEDVAGNSVVASFFLGVDGIIPSLTIDLSCDEMGFSGWCRGTWSVTLACTDDGSGVSPGFPKHSLNGAPLATSPGTLTVAQDGAHSLRVVCDDIAGNRDDETHSLLRDATPPTAAVIVPTASVGSHAVQWTAQDPASGLALSLMVQVQNVVGGWTGLCAPAVAGPTASGSCMHNHLLQPGLYCYRIIVSDAAGNQVVTNGDACTIGT